MFIKHLRAWIAIPAFLLVAFGLSAQPFGPVMGRAGQFWGTFFWRTSTPTAALPPALITFSAEGNIVGTDGSMFGAANPAIRLSSLHGTWVRTGWRTLGGTSLYLVMNATSGAPMAIGRSRSTLEFAQDFDSFQGKMFLETLPCAPGPPVACPDPAASGVQWVPSPQMPAGGFDVKGSRVERVAAGPL